MSKIISTILFALIIVLALPNHTEADKYTPKVFSVTETLSKYALFYGTPEKELIAVSFCESSHNPRAWNKKDPGVGSKGIMQFQTATFLSYAKKVGIQNPDIWNIDQQAQVAAYMFAHGQKAQWSCSKKLHFV